MEGSGTKATRRDMKRHEHREPTDAILRVRTGAGGTSEAGGERIVVIGPTDQNASFTRTSIVRLSVAN